MQCMQRSFKTATINWDYQYYNNLLPGSGINLCWEKITMTLGWSNTTFKGGCKRTYRNGW